MSSSSDTSDATTINKWVTDLDNIDINKLHPKIKCVFLMVVEQSSVFTKMVKMVEFYSSIITGGKLIAVSIRDIYEFVNNRKIKQPHWDDYFFDIISAACVEADLYVHTQQPIPVDLLVKLIKLKIISIIKEVIFFQRREATLRQQKSYFKPPVAEGNLNEKKKGKGKAKDKNAKTDKLKQSKSKKKEVIVEQNPCLGYQYTPMEEIVPDENVDICGASVYIVLFGFFLPSLISLCYLHGIPLMCLVKFGEAKYKHNKFSSSTSLDSVYFKDDTLISPNKYLPKQQLRKKKESTLSLFWKIVNEMYKREKLPYIKDSFIMIYTPLLFFVNKRNARLYLDQCEQLYEDFSRFVNKLEDYQRQYTTYLENLKIYNLDIKPKKIEAHEMKLYKDTLDAIPIDVISVSLILDSLIKEICSQEQESSTMLTGKKTVEESEENSIMKQSYHFEQDNELHHRSLRDQLKKIFMHFKISNSTCLPREPNTNKFKSSINDKPYITHESNFLEMTLNYYKYLPHSILDTMITYLKKYRCINALIDLPPLTDSTISRNKQEIRKWCALLGIDELDLSLCLSVIFMGMFDCSEEICTSRENLILGEHIPVEKTVHEIQANIPNKGNRKVTRCVDETNQYEKINPSELKWVDRLPPVVALQELSKASEQFEFADWRYVKLFDLMLYRFHHDVDDFGIATKFWKETVRSPVSFNDFMTYVLHMESKIIAEQNEKCEEFKKLQDCIKETAEDISEFSLCSEDFILPGSLKDKCLHRIPTEVDLKAVKGKRGKEKKDQKGNKNNKIGSKVKPKNKSAVGKNNKVDTIDARAVVEDEPLKSDFDNYYFDIASLKKDYSQNINAVDFNGLLLTSSGISTSFYSIDDLKVVVDQFRVCDQETKLSTKISLNGHDLIVHRTFHEDFSFLVNFKSGAVLACGKPNFPFTEIDIDFYLLSEESEKIINCMRSLFNTRRNIIIMGEDLKKILKPSKKDSKKGPTRISGSAHRFSTKGSKASMTTTSITRRSAVSKASAVSSHHHAQRKTRTYDVSSAHSTIPNLSVPGFVNEVKLLKKMFSTLSPKFKVCSSKLHQYYFIKRVTMPIELDLNQIIRFVIRAKRENKRRLTVTKRYNIKAKSVKASYAYEYDFRITLPSGLHVRNIIGEKGTHICQYYFQKQVIHGPTFDENYRLFLGNGTVAVKNDDGSFILYAANGEIVKYETVLTKELPHNIHHHNADISRTTIKFLKHVRRNIYDVTKGSKKVDHLMSSRRMSKKGVKRFKCRKSNNPFSNIKFSFTTSEGNIIRYENGVLTECDAFYVEKEDALKTGQVIFRREDGTVSILTDEGHMQTVFSDGTKITVWCEMDTKPVVIDLTDTFGSDYEDMGSFVKVITCYQYEHPYYITVLSNGSDEKLMLRNATGEIFDISNKHFLVGIDESTTLLANKEIIRFVGTPCDECGKYCECDVYIKQLYDPPPAIEKEKLLLKVRDTYNKSFVLFYDGSIERNEEYVRERSKCSHASHKIQPTQAFFSLNRDLSGCNFWTDDHYNKRLSQANDPETDYLVLYVGKKCDEILTTEWKIFEKQHYNLRFVWQQVKPICEDKIEEFDISTAAFVRQRIVKKIPANAVRNLIKIINDNKDSFLSNLFDTQSSSNVSLLSDISEDYESAIDDKNTRKVEYEKRIKKRNMECMDVVDKIIEYFVKKTGRYYRSKVYEDFCGVKLMLDDEEEIFFLANFDGSVHTSSNSEELSNSSEDLNKTQSLSRSTELIKSKLSRSTSAVETAIEVIKQLEMEKQRALNKSMIPQSVPSLKLNNVSQHQDSAMENLTLGGHPSARSLDTGRPNSKHSCTIITGKVPSILKTPRRTDSPRIVHSPTSVSDGIKIREVRVRTYENKFEDCKISNESNEKEPVSSASSSSLSQQTLDEQDVDQTLKAISQTLKRIRREKFGYYVARKGDSIQTESESSLTEITVEDTSEGPIFEMGKENRDGNIHTDSIKTDLFHIPRKSAVVVKIDSREPVKMTARESVLSDTCYSNFSFEDIGMANFLKESVSSESSNIVVEEEKISPPIQPSKVSIMRQKSYESEKPTTSLTFGKDYLKIIHETDVSDVSEFSSIQDTSESHFTNLLQSTPSMIPLLNVKSLTTQYHSDLDTALKSVVSFVGAQARTSSMRVLRSMSQFDKDFELVIVEHAGIVTDKFKTKEVQTDLLFDDSDGEVSV